MPPADVVAWLRRSPGNARLRRLVYERLAAAGRTKELASIVAGAVPPGARAHGDDYAVLAARVAVGEPADLDALVRDLRARAS